MEISRFPVPQNLSKQPIRVAHVLGRLAHGGVEAVVLGYYRHMNRQRITFDFFVFTDSPQTIPPEILRLGCGVHLIPPVTSPIAHVYKLYRLFCQEQYAIVHIHLNTLSLFPLLAAWLAGVPIRILHNHSTSSTYGETARSLLKMILRPLSKCFANRYVACSRLAAQWMFGQKALRQGKVTLLHNAVELSSFVFDQDLRQHLRAQMGLSDKFVIGHVGRFMPQKNHVFLLAVFSAIRGVRSNAVLLLVGDGPLEAEIRQKVLDMGLAASVIFVGGVSSTREYYQVMDIFLLPSLYEGLPVVGVEAQAAGLPIFVSHEVTDELSVTPLVHRMPKGASPEAWMQAVMSLPQPFPRQDMTEALSKAGFSLRNASKDLERFYLSLVPEKDSEHPW